MTHFQLTKQIISGPLSVQHIFSATDYSLSVTKRDSAARIRSRQGHWAQPIAERAPHHLGAQVTHADDFELHQQWLISAHRPEVDNACTCQWRLWIILYLVPRDVRFDCLLNWIWNRPPTHPHPVIWLSFDPYPKSIFHPLALTPPLHTDQSFQPGVRRHDWRRAGVRSIQAGREGLLCSIRHSREVSYPYQRGRGAGECKTMTIGINLMV